MSSTARTSNSNLKQVLQDIINHPTSHTQPIVKTDKRSQVLKRQLNCLEASNNLLSEQLSQEIEKKECFAELLSK